MRYCFCLIAIFLSGAVSVQAQSKAFADAKLAYSLAWDVDWVTAVQFIGPNQVAAGNKLGDILVWDLPDMLEGKAPMPSRRLAGHTNEVTRMAVTPDLKTLITASNDHTIKYWNMDAKAEGTSTVDLNSRARYDAESRKKKSVPSLEAKVATQKYAQELLGHDDWILGMSMTPDGKTLLSGDDKGLVIVWDCAAGKEIRRWKLDAWVWGLGISPDGQSALIAERVHLIFDSGAKTGLKMWNVQDGKMKADLAKAIQGRMATAGYSPDGKWLAVGQGGQSNDDLDGKITLIDPATGKKGQVLSPGHLGGALDLAYHPDGKHLFTCGRDNLVKIWSLEDGKRVRDLSRGGQSKDPVFAISISPDGKRLAAADMGGQVHIWSLDK